MSRPNSPTSSVVEANAGPSGTSARRSEISASRSSSDSTASYHSAVAVQIIESDESLRTITRQISLDLHQLNDLASHLKDWLNTIDPAGYAREPWTEDMQKAYDDYKDLCKAHHEAKAKFKKFHTTFMTPEDSAYRAGLAVQVGDTACRAGAARLRFLDNYRNAYPMAKIEGHISQGQAKLNAARNAVETAREEFEEAEKLFQRLDTNVLQ